MDHCEGFLPWAARSSIWGHWIDADALRYRWLLLGDEVSGELYRDWGRALIDARMHLGADREGVTTLGELVAYYRQTHDPRALVSIAEWSESVLSRPFEEYRQPTSFPSWHREWMARLAELRRDPRIVERARRLLDAGYGDAATVAFVARADGAHGRDASAHRERIERELERLEGLALQRFDSPGDPLDGYGPWWANRSAVPLYTAPYLLDAAREFGIAIGGRGGVETYYPAAATYSVERGRGRGPGLEVWIEDVRDSELELRIRRPPGYGDLGAISYRVLAPSGREIASATAPGEAAADEIVLRLPPDGESGLYRFECRGHRCGLAAPISDAPEGAALTPGSVYRAAGRGDFRLTAPAGGPLGLRLAASPGVTPAHPQTATPAWFEVGSAGSNEPLRSGSLFAYGEPSSMTLDLRPTAVAVEGRPGGGPSLPVHWALSTASRFGPSIEVLGDAPFVLLTSGRRPTKDAESIGERAVEAGLVPSRPNAPPPRRPTKR